MTTMVNKSGVAGHVTFNGEYAIKHFNMNTYYLREILARIVIGNNVRGMSVMRSHDPVTMTMVMDRYDGDLYDLMIGRRSITENDVYNLVIDICIPLGYMHNLNIYHCDIKPKNILYKIGRDGVIRFFLADFGSVGYGKWSKTIATTRQYCSDSSCGDAYHDMFGLSLVVKELCSQFTISSHRISRIINMMDDRTITGGRIISNLGGSKSSRPSPIQMSGRAVYPLSSGAEALARTYVNMEASELIRDLAQYTKNSDPLTMKAVIAIILSMTQYDLILPPLITEENASQVTAMAISIIPLLRRKIMNICITNPPLQGRREDTIHIHRRNITTPSNDPRPTFQNGMNLPSNGMNLPSNGMSTRHGYPKIIPSYRM